MNLGTHRTLTVLAGAALLVGGANLAVQAAGAKPLLLGASNAAAKTTTLKTTGNGPALKLKVKAGKPPLAVSSSGKVAKLNADLVDGRSASDLGTRARVYSVPAGIESAGFTLKFPGLPQGKYQASYVIYADASNASATGQCLFRNSTETVYTGLASFGHHFSTFDASATAYVDTTLGYDQLYCVVSAGTIAPSSVASSVMFVPIDQATVGAASVS